MFYQSLWQSLSALYDPREAQAIVRMVLEEKYGMTLTDIVCGGIDKLTETQKNELQALMLRLQTGEPVQYVLGYAWFCGRKFHVEPGVLIPRPETEQLCSLTIQKSQSSIFKPKILDIGTGSGCIAITLGLEMPGADVYAIDVSDNALRVAEYNAKALDTHVSFMKRDILSDKSITSILPEGKKFQMIVSNPPYIALRERSAMSVNVLDHEPSLALFVPDDDPLLFYRAIGRQAIKSLEPQGRLYFEINPLFANELKKMLLDQGFANVEIVDDEFGKHRFAVATM